MLKNQPRTVNSGLTSHQHLGHTKTGMKCRLKDRRGRGSGGRVCDREMVLGIIQYREVLLIRIVGQGPTMLAESTMVVCNYLSSLISLFLLPLSEIRLDTD